MFTDCIRLTIAAFVYLQPCLPARGSRLALSLLFLFAFVMGMASPALGEEKFCSQYGGVIDGNVFATPPTQITIDTDCTFQNWPEYNPLTTTVNFQTNDPSIYLIIFDNVTFTGNMACANIDHRIWFSNGSYYGSSNACQDLFIPVETIDKENPAGQTTASIGVPFTYTLTLPSMQLSGDPSINDLHTVTLWDDLTATGADLTFVGINAYHKGSGAPVNLVPENDPTAPGGAWTPKNLSYKPIPLISAGDQVVVEITVVPDDTPANAAGTQFVNTAKWWFGRLIDGTFYEPLPGEWGVTQPMTIAEPDLVVTKTSSETALNLGVPATFTIDVQNAGGSPAWNATILDLLPDGADAGMCDFDPATTVTARIAAADGTLVSSLVQGTDYSVVYDGAPACRLSFSMLTPAAAIGPSEHLIATYRSQLDADSTDGVTLTNVAGATGWESGDGSQPVRTYTRTLSDGTPSFVDYQDSQQITTALSGYYFQKTVQNLTDGTDPATTAAPGDRLRYRLRLFNVDQTIDAITIGDQLDVSSFDPATFSMVTPPPAGGSYSFDPASGLLEISGDGAPLDVPVGGELVVEFEITLESTLANGSAVANQASLSATGLTALSDDPFVNGIAPPGDPADPTTVAIHSPGPLSKANTRASATVGEEFTYRIAVPATPVDVPLYDVRILDDLGLSAADMYFVRADVVSGGAWTPRNTGSATDLVIEDTATGIDIPAGGQAVVEITVVLRNTAANRSGLSFGNGASYTYDRVNGNAGSRTAGGSGSATGMNVVEPALTAAKAVRFVSPAGKPATDSATPGDVLEYAVTITNGGGSTAFDTSVADTLPAGVSLVPGSAAAMIGGVAVAGFVPDPSPLPGGGVVWGDRNGDETLDIPAGRSLVLTYQVVVESVTGTDIENSVYADWSSLNGASADERTGAGCPSTVAPDDYCTGPATVAIGTVDNTSIAKAVADSSYAGAPAGTTDPVVRVGDTVTYELTLNLQEYTTRGVVVEDALPEGMALESFTIDGSSFSYVPAAQPAPGDTGTLRWDFGDISNPPSNDGTPTDPLTIRYIARILPDAPPVGVTYEASILRDNAAKLSYASGDPALYPDRLTATERVEVRQPRMSAIGKAVIGGAPAGAGTAADPYRVDLATDVMNFRLSSCNDGQAPAYGVTLTDLLAPELDEGDLAANPPVVRIGATTLTAGSDYTATLPGRGGEMRIALLDSAPVNPGECVAADYSVGFHTDLTVSKTWSNQARLPEYRSLPLSEPGRLYAPTDAAQVWMTNLVNPEQLLKTLASPGEATVGGEVVYRIAVPAAPMNRALDDVVVTDTLNGALEYVGAVAVDASGAAVALTDNSVAPGAVNLGIAHIPAGGQAIITLRARVANNGLANAGVSFANTASYTYAGIPAGLDTASTSGPLTLIEPAVSIARSVTNVSHPGVPPSPGDVLRYSVSFTAGGGAAGDGFSDAFDLELVDSLSVGLAYKSGTAAVDGAGNAVVDPAVTGDGLATAQTLTWSPADATAGIDVPEGTTVTLTYDAVVLDGVLPGQDLTSSATARWTGLGGDSAFERTGSGTPAENDYFTGPVALTVTAALAVPFEKSVVNVTTGDDPGTNARPGDTLRYTLVLTNESITPLNGASVTDELAAQFAPGTLRLVSVPAGADAAATDPSGGASGMGIVDIRNLTLAPQGDPGDTLSIVFEATLATVLPSGTAVTNLARLTGENLAPATSNETSTLIASAPAFEVWKTSADLTGDPSVLRAGDILRYTIVVKNVGNENAVGAVLRDGIPVNTTYVPGSTTLNGSPLADPASGISPLQDGGAIHAPNAGAGSLPADPAATSGNVATVAFDVVIDADVVDGAIISNQGFLDASGEGSGPAPEKPSDDPATAIPDDPTLDVVGYVPLVDAHKTVQILVDGGSPGIVDPGDVLRYTIAVSNVGATSATGVVFIDAVPANTTYVPDSVRLNGLAVGQPDGGISPLVAGIDVSSSDLTPPLPGPGAGVLSAGSSAEIVFDVRVNDGVAPGTVISNQGMVKTAELTDEPTDADGIDSNGDQPTQIVVGDVQQLIILKEVSVVGGSTAQPGGELEYAIRVTNIGSLPATRVTVTDDLGALSGQASYVGGSGTLNGSAAGVSYAGSVLTADYATAYGALAPGAGAVVRFRVRIDPATAIGTTITNTGVVSWDDPPRTASAAVSLDVGGTPGSGILGGRVWHDASLDKVYDSPEKPLSGWSVELYRAGRLLATVPTDGEGVWRLSGLAPNEGNSDPYELFFRAAGAGPNTASLGTADSPFVNGPQRIGGVTVASGGNLQGLNLPITPNGAVYDSVQRTPVAGARLAMVNAATGTPLPEQCFEDSAQQNQSTASDGFYKFDVNFSDPSCRPGDTYFIEVTPPAAGYVATPSQIIPPNGAPADPFSVPDCPGSPDDAVPATAEYCEATASASEPPTSVAPRTEGTVYHLYMMLNDASAGGSQIFNNHIPVDPELGGAVAITKISPLVNVSKGQLVPYTITVTNVLGAPLYDMAIVDRFPAGFKYVEGSARLDGEKREPHIGGRELLWDGLDLQVDGKHTLQLLLVVGAGVSEGEYVNRAQVLNTATGGGVSGEASATVRVVPDPTFDCTDVIGKVFDDRDLDGSQDEGEEGLAGVRVATARGLIATTDAFGRFHIACATVPDEDRGSNFILKLDDRTLPTGYRVTTENPRVQRATRGKMLKFDFGATIHRVVSIDIAEGAFEPETTDLRLQWKPRIGELLEALRKGPSVLRLSYLADVEGEGLVKRRLKALKKEISKRWGRSEDGYRLTIETEVFWRRGGPVR